MDSDIEILSKKLSDERSKKVIFLSHCLLNENTRYLGGAFRAGCINEIVEEIQKRGIGIVQIKCPEQEAWGGVLKRSMWIPLYRKSWFVKRVLLPLFLWRTKRRYNKIAQEVVNNITDYRNSGFDIIGIVGVSASPTCGVHTTIDITKFTEFLGNSSLEEIDRKRLNDEYVKQSIVTGNGLFISLLKNLLDQSNLPIKLYEHDLVKEMNGEKVRFEI